MKLELSWSWSWMMKLERVQTKSRQARQMTPFLLSKGGMGREE
jgi:hypothetical protein